MAKLKVTISMDNDAFDSDNTEVARILRELADRMETTGYGYEEYKLQDVNGNTVGKALVV